MRRSRARPAERSLTSGQSYWVPLEIGSQIAPRTFFKFHVLLVPAIGLGFELTKRHSIATRETIRVTKAVHCPFLTRVQQGQHFLAKRTHKSERR